MAPCFPDTSCLIHLERIGRLDLLRALYDDVRIPPAVRDEFGRVPEGFAVEAAENPGLVRTVKSVLGALPGTGFWISDALYAHALRRAGEEG